MYKKEKKFGVTEAQAGRGVQGKIYYPVNRTSVLYLDKHQSKEYYVWSKEMKMYDHKIDL